MLRSVVTNGLVCGIIRAAAGVVELVDTTDLKSVDFTVVPVQVRPPAPALKRRYLGNAFFLWLFLGRREYAGAND